MSENLRARKAGIFIVAALALSSLAGHLLTTHDSNALPTTTLESSDEVVTIEGKLDRTSVLKGGDGLVKMELTLRAVQVASSKVLAPADMIVVLDRSGSMSGEKIEAARAAVVELIDQLGPEDRMALVAFSSGAELLVPFAQATPVAKAAWRRQVERVGAGGGTDMSRGLDLALELARESADVARIGRVLLISDGRAGNPAEELLHRATEVSRLEFVLSSIGVGEQFNEDLMTSMADAGTGNFYYLSDSRQLAEVFAGEFEATRETVARAVAVTIEPASGVEVVDAAGYPLETSQGAVTFRPGALFAGQERRVWVTLKVPHSEPGDYGLGALRATYRHDGVERSLSLPEPPQIACVENHDAWVAGIDKESWERSVVEEDYGQLRRKVAAHVKSGRRQEALEEIRAYGVANSMMNEDMDSAAVASNLEELGKLEAEVEDAFVGEEPLRRLKQNSLSKKQQALSWELRRLGAKNDTKPEGER